METHSFKAAYETGMAKISVMLGVYLFKEDNVFITYCPALDLSGYGYDEREAKLSFAEVMRQYLDYCLHKHTLVKDLQRLGWNIKSMKKCTVYFKIIFLIILKWLENSLLKNYCFYL